MLAASGAPAQSGTTAAVVLEGTLSANGMVSFREFVGEDETVALRAYLVSLAQAALVEQ